MINWENIRFLSMLAAEGTLSGAARKLGVEHATVARRVAALEADTGLKLIDRRGRRLQLTADGERIAGIAKRMSAEAEALTRLIASHRGTTTLEGAVTISAPPGFALARLVQPLADFHIAHPRIQITLLGEARKVSLDKREADIVVRLDRPDKGDFIIRKIGTLDFYLYASSEYLAKTPREEWVYIGYDKSMDRSPSQRWLHQNTDSAFGIRTNGLEMQRSFAAMNVGVALLPEVVAKVEHGIIQVSPAEKPASSREVWMAVHRDLKDVPEIKAVWMALAEIATDRE